MLQFLSIGPENSDYNVLSNFFSRYAAANLDQIIDFRGDIYWIALFTSTGFCVGLIYCFGVILTGHHHSQYTNVFSKFNYYLVQIFVGILGNAVYLPIISILITIYECNESKGEDLTDSFLDRDCFTFCWNSSHLYISITTLILLTLYIPSHLYSLLYRHAFQQPSNINIKLQYLLFKTLVQILAIIINKTLKFYSLWIFSVVYVVVMLLYLSLMIKLMPFNYKRLNFWAYSSIVAVIWSSTVSLTHSFSDYKNNNVWGRVLIIG